MGSRYERLTGADRMNLLAERPGTPWHVGLVGVLDGRPLTAPDGTLDVAAVTRFLGAAVPRAPRLHQVVRPTRLGQGPPLWLDAGPVDVAAHLTVSPVGGAGDRPAFLDACARVLRPPMDRSRPLWDLTLLPGLAGGDVGVVLRLHHAVADGEAAVAVLGALFGSGEASAATRPLPVPAPAPSGPDLARDAWRTRATAVRHALRRWPDSSRLMATTRAVTAQARGVLRPAEPVPATSLLGPLGPGRRLAQVRVPLAPLHDVARAHGASINDAVLAAVASGLHAVLATRGEDPDVVLRASVPVSLRGGAGADGAAGNRVGVLLVPLPLGEPDTVRRMERIAAATAAEKVRARDAGPLVVLTSTLGARLALPLMRRQRLVSVFVTNVRGPAVPLSLAGARLLEAYPAAPIAGNVTLGVGVLSYAGALGLGVVADAASWPDLRVFVVGLTAALEDLVDGAADGSQHPAGPG